MATLRNDQELMSTGSAFRTNLLRIAREHLLGCFILTSVGLLPGLISLARVSALTILPMVWTALVIVLLFWIAGHAIATEKKRWWNLHARPRLVFRRLLVTYRT
jgi:hypothetical protein